MVDKSSFLPGKHIAILVPSLAGGGAEFVARTWAAGLVERGARVTLLLTHSETEEDVPLGAEVVEIPSVGFISRLRRLRRVIQQLRPAAVISLMPHWNVLALAATRGIGDVKVLISGRNAESVLVGSVSATFRLEIFLARLLYRRTDGYIAISHPVAAEAITKYRIDPQRVWVVPNPATAKISPSLALERRSGRASRKPGNRVILTVPARIVEQKRPVIAVRVAKILAGRGLDVEVHYFGDGNLRELVQAEADRAAVPVRFHGWVNEWFLECDKDSVVLLPSVAEGFGNVLVEAAAVGVPSVATSQALGLADAVVAGVTGELTIDADVEGFADAVERAMALPPIAEEGWLERFSPGTSTDLLVESIQRVLTRSSRQEE
ncbi:glycosyltransferase [Microbacterium gubbeenense]|uniref:glycosyltransferase n=1 Tax=Microbacterium gubbeenense TaxID=159896 RepID=UPI000A06E0BC|nr:glycosyltransferase [Microbacterium gubbeenense]